jgi:hypothetical protein
MANRYNRKSVLSELRTMVLTKCKEVYTTNRETVKATTDKFVIIKLPQGIDPYADTHNTAYVQFQLFAKDVSNGVESIDRMESLIDGISELFPFNNGHISCNDTPIQLPSKSDGMGYHSVILQFQIVIKYNI